MQTNDYDDDGNNIVPCPICLDVHCPSKNDGKCPKEDEFVKDINTNPPLKKTSIKEVSITNLIKTVTGEQLKELKKQQLDAAFIEKYPHGRFTLENIWVKQWNNIKNKAEKPRELYILAHEIKRPTSWTKYPSTCFEYDTTTKKITKQKYFYSYVHTKKNTKFFKTMDECMTYAKRKNIPTELIKTFTNEIHKNHEKN